MDFRKDINGLRALAVIPVILFHFNSAWLPGGFAGVDVFFVISGFLMTGIIVKGISNNTFSIVKFYIARANRIVPALAVLCFVLLLLGWFYLSPVDYQLLGKHVLASITFLSNIVYWQEAGYFDTASHGKWLLHTWSLSAEWQFYLIYPVVLVVLCKLFCFEKMKRIILILTLFSLIFSILITYKWPNLAYYFLPTRAWEMLAGGIAYLFPLRVKESNKAKLELLGISLIISSYFFISKSDLWPGYLALIPVSGVYLIIQAKRDESTLLNNPFMQKIGMWSYSIYLWHWPIAVTIYYLSLKAHWVVYIGISLSVLLGFLSHKYIEQLKFKKTYSALKDYLSCKPMYMMVLIGCIGTIVYITNGVQSHYSDEVIQISNDKISNNIHQAHCFPSPSSKDESDIYKKCYITKTNKSVQKSYGSTKAILIGDSHALAQLSVVVESLVADDDNILFYASPACLPIDITIKSVGKDISFCNKRNDNLFNKVLPDNPNIPVIFVLRMPIYFNGYNELAMKGQENIDIRYINKLPKSNVDLIQQNTQIKDAFIGMACRITEKRDVYITETAPEFGTEVPNKLMRAYIFNNKIHDITLPIKTYEQRNKFTTSLLSEVQTKCGTTTLKLSNYLCDEMQCFGSKNGLPLYKDDDHFSEFGNKVLLPMYKDIWLK